MIDRIFEFIASHPIFVAIVVSYFLSFIAIRQIKPFLTHVCLDIPWLPDDLGKRLILRFAVLLCGFLVSLVVTGFLVVFELNLTWSKVIYISISVGILSPMVYDSLLFSIRLLEAFKLVPRGVHLKVETWLDPQKKISFVRNSKGEIEKIREGGKTVWKLKK
jgi:hypothetical protein